MPAVQRLRHRLRAKSLLKARRKGADGAECTARSRFWFSEGPPAEVFVCAVRVENGLCDRYRVDRDGADFRVRVLERRASCVLPVG